MSEKIEPALSAEDLNRISESNGEFVIALPTPDRPEWKSEYRLRVKRGFEAQLIAFANHVMPNDDPRKITREKLARIRDIADAAEDDSGSEYAALSVVRHFADALESYLPPRE